MAVVTCSACAQAVTLPDDGQTYSCPFCRTPITAPPAAEEEELDFTSQPRRPRRRARVGREVWGCVVYQVSVLLFIIALIAMVAFFGHVAGGIGLVIGLVIAGYFIAVGPTKHCPECGERVKDAANVCRYCGYRF